MRPISFLTTLLSVSGSLCAPAAADDAFKEFKSWQVLCSQTQSCSMRQFMSSSPISQIEVKRSGAPNAPVLLVLTPADASIISTEAPGASTLRIDAGDARQLSGSAVAADADAGTVTLSGDFIDDGFLAELKNGKTLTVTLPGKEGEVSATIALAGAAASLLFIDEFQERDGHTDAMVAKGPKAPNAARPLADIARVADLPAGLQGYFAEGGLCADTSDTLLDGNALSHTLDDGSVLYVIPCGMGGAYNMPYAVFAEAGETVTPLAFPVMQDGAPSATPFAYNLSYEPESQRFSAFFKGRGVGDCGTVSEWKLTPNAGGLALLLVEEAFQDCTGSFDENAAVDPSNWPKTWPLN